MLISADLIYFYFFFYQKERNYYLGTYTNYQPEILRR